MRFVKLQSLEGQSALHRALEAPSVARVSKGLLKVDDLLGMQDAEVEAAFRLIRWPETKGMPVCPRCGCLQSYDLKSRSRFKCIQCHHQYSMLSGTNLHSAKMPMRNYLFILSLLLDRSQFESILHFTKELKLNYKSVWSKLQCMRISADGARGSTVPPALLERAVWIAHRSKVMETLRGFSLRTLKVRSGGGIASLQYPYMREDQVKVDGAELLAFVNSLVPRHFPDYIRADVCQDMVVAILAGEQSRDKISANAKKFVTAVMAASPWKYRWLSFDVPASDSETKRSLHEVIADPNSERPFQHECDDEAFA